MNWKTLTMLSNTGQDLKIQLQTHYQELCKNVKITQMRIHAMNCRRESRFWKKVEGGGNSIFQALHMVMEDIRVEIDSELPEDH